MTGGELRRRYAAGERDFRHADLRHADLRRADLRHSDLTGANLSHADLTGAKLSHADLRYAHLTRADLTNADLCYADLRYAHLTRADLTGAVLTDTCLDPEIPLPPISDAEIIEAGLEPHGGYVYGWRTARSDISGDTIYEPGRIYVAPWFSADSDTSCHPGIYLAGIGWLDWYYHGWSLVGVRCQRADLLHAGDKWRCRAVEVIREQ